MFRWKSEGKLATDAFPAKLIGSAFAQLYTGTDRSRNRTYACALY